MLNNVKSKLMAVFSIPKESECPPLRSRSPRRIAGKKPMTSNPQGPQQWKCSNNKVHFPLKKSFPTPSLQISSNRKIEPVVANEKSKV